MKHPRLQLNKRAFWCGVAVLVLLRCGLTSFQQAYTWVGGAPLDDELMFRAAQAITAGHYTEHDACPFCGRYFFY